MANYEVTILPVTDNMISFKTIENRFDASNSSRSATPVNQTDFNHVFCGTSDLYFDMIVCDEFDDG